MIGILEENNVAGFFEGTVLEKGYGYISREIMRNPNISKGAKVVYCYLLSFAGDKFNAFPKVSTVCHELGFGNQGTYYKYLNELKKHGLLYTDLIKNEDGKWEKNIFHLTRNKSDIEKVKLFNKNVKNKLSKKVKTAKNIDNTKKEPYFKKRSTENESTENLSTNINNSNKNIINIEEDEEVFNAYKEVKNRYLNTREREKLKEMLKLYSKDLILKAIDVMVTDAEKITLKYVISTLDDWKTKGIQTVEEVDKMRSEWLETKRKAKENKQKVVRSKTGEKPSNFNNFKHRDEYNDDEYVNDMEMKLLGWK